MGSAKKNMKALGVPQDFLGAQRVLRREKVWETQTSSIHVDSKCLC